MGNGFSFNFSLTPIIPCLDKFYKNMNEIKNDLGGNKILLLSKILINHT